MLESQCVIDVNKDIRAPIAKLVKDSDNGDVGDLDLKVVGQEQDGCLLYAWAGQNPLRQPDSDEGVSPKVTHVGLYEPINKINKTLFVLEKLVDIINCTVSQERTLIGFVTLEQTYISEGYGRRQKQDKYQAYLAEVSSPSVASRVFYLNLERSHYIRLQFLYGRYRGQVSRREAHLLVLLHGESIGLYHIPMARVGDDGIIISGEPKKEQIFQKRFVWSQWDPIYQRLFVAQFRRQSKTSSGSQYPCYLTGYQFTEATTNEFMLDVPLDLPVPFWKSNSHRSHYMKPAPYQTIPDNAVNMCVLTQNNGTLCICFQHPCPPSRGSKSGSPTSPTPPEEPISSSLQYSVVIVHHGKKLTCSAIPVPEIVARKARIVFMLIGDYLVVHLDGYFTHLLNVGVDYESCHHILWHDESGSSVVDEPVLPSYLTPLIWDRYASMQSSGALVFNPRTQKCYKLTVSRDTLLTFFTDSPSPATRLAILHFAAVHQRDLPFTKKLFESILSDPANPEMVGLFEEFLIGSTYISLRRQMELYVMRYIPFTCATSFRGQTETDRAGNRVCSINYTTINPVTLRNLAKVRSDHHTAEMWTHLEETLGTTPAASRFTSCNVRRYMDTFDDDEQEFVKVHSAELPSLFQKLATAAKSALTSSRTGAGTESGSGPGLYRHPSRSEVLLGRPPDFLSATPRTADRRQEQLISTTSDYLSTHLRRFLKRDSRSKIRCIATEYIECQMQQSHHLAHLICAFLLPPDKFSGLSLSTNVVSADYDLFLVCERYQLALNQQAFPHPPGFPLFFICLAFRCLRFSVLSQYLENKVLHATEEFMERLIEDLPDTEENTAVKFAVLRHLPPDAGISCARLWSHPLSRRFLAKHYTDACLSDGEKEEFAPVYKEASQHAAKTEGEIEGESATRHGVGFPPLVTLISAMEKKVSRQIERGKSGDHPIDRHLIQEASLAQLYGSGVQHEDIITYG